MRPHGTAQRLPYKWELIALLWVAFFLNQADRQVYNVVLPLIKADLKLSDDQLGLVVLVFTWTYGSWCRWRATPATCCAASGSSA